MMTRYKYILRTNEEPKDKGVIWNYNNKLLIYEDNRWKSMLGEYNGLDSNEVNALRLLVNDLTQVINAIISQNGILRITETK